MSLTKIVLVGASGNIGAGVVPQLLESGLDITILSREGSPAAFPKETKVIKSDFSEESLVQALRGQDAVVSMLPIIALGEQTKVAGAAVKAGATRFIPIGHEMTIRATYDDVSVPSLFIDLLRKTFGR